jgi:hypothetical protein
LINEARNINNSIKANETPPNADADTTPEVPAGSRSDRSARKPLTRGNAPDLHLCASGPYSRRLSAQVWGFGILN